MRRLIIKVLSSLLSEIFKRKWLLSLINDANIARNSNKFNKQKHNNYALKAEFEEIFQEYKANRSIRYLEGALLVSGCRVAFKNNSATHFDFSLSDHAVYYSDEERNGVFNVTDENIYGKSFRRNKYLYIYLSYSKEYKFDTVLPLFSINRNNFFHFLIDYLSVLCQLDPAEDPNLIVLYDKALPIKYFELMVRLYPNFRYAAVDSGQLVTTSKIILPKRAVEHRHWLRTNEVEAISKTNAAVLRLLNEHVNEKFTSVSKGSRNIVLLERHSSFRTTVNQSSLQKRLRSEFGNKFENIDPGSLGFQRTSSAIQNAQVVISQTGAALTNAIFSKNPQIWIVWMFRHERQDEKMFANFLESLGHQVIILGAGAVQRLDTFDSDQRDPSQFDLIVNENEIITKVREALAETQDE